jgi:hypothetical protein
VADRLFVDLTADGRVSVSTGLGSEFLGGETEEQHELAWPLDADALEELRWYLEDYLRAPFGAYETRGHDVAAKLAPWGEAVFEAKRDCTLYSGRPWRSCSHCRGNSCATRR